MNKIVEFLTNMNEVPMKLILRVSLKWAIGLLPFLLPFIILLFLFFHFVDKIVRPFLFIR